MKDLKILVLMMALKPLPDFSQPMSYQMFFFLLALHLFSYFLKQEHYEAPFLKTQDHARMNDLKIPVPMVALKPLHDFPDPFCTKRSFYSTLLFFSQFLKKGYKAPFLEPQDHARMKDLKIPVLIVALKPLHDFSRPISYQNVVFILRFFFSHVLEKGYKASFLEPQDHARMKDLKIPVLMVALKPLHDLSRPNS